MPHLHDCELNSVEAVFLRLQGKLATRNVEDKVEWMASKSGNFSVKSYYLGARKTRVPADVIWNS